MKFARSRKWCLMFFCSSVYCVHVCSFPVRRCLFNCLQPCIYNLSMSEGTRSPRNEIFLGIDQFKNPSFAQREEKKKDIILFLRGFGLV